MARTETDYGERLEAARRLVDGLSARLESMPRGSLQMHWADLRSALAALAQLTSDLGISQAAVPPTVDDHALGPALAVIGHDLIDYLSDHHDEQSLEEARRIVLGLRRVAV